MSPELISHLLFPKSGVVYGRIRLKAVALIKQYGRKCFRKGAQAQKNQDYEYLKGYFPNNQIPMDVPLVNFSSADPLKQQ